MARLLVLTHLNHSGCLWNHKCRWVWALLCQSPERLLGQIHGFFLNKGGTCNLVFCLPLKCYLSFSFRCWKMHLDCKDFSSCNKKKQRMIYVFLGILCKYREEENHSAHLSEDQALILLLFTSLEVFPDLQWHQCFNFTADCDPIPLSYWAKKGQVSNS